MSVGRDQMGVESVATLVTGGVLAQAMGHGGHLCWIVGRRSDFCVFVVDLLARNSQPGA